MSLIGKTVKHYEITAQFGRGGIGEVYQAKDRKLRRDVTIKVLPGVCTEFLQYEQIQVLEQTHRLVLSAGGIPCAAGTSFNA
jgi:hypothetical protein